jgi:hypothetical protein
MGEDDHPVFTFKTTNRRVDLPRILLNWIFDFPMCLIDTC